MSEKAALPLSYIGSNSAKKPSGSKGEFSAKSPLEVLLKYFFRKLWYVFCVNSISPKTPKTPNSNITKSGSVFNIQVVFRSEGKAFFRRQAKANTLKEAKAKRDEFYVEFNRLAVGQASPTVSRVVRQPEIELQQVSAGPTLAVWLEDCVLKWWPRIIPTTVRDYADPCRLHIIPALGSVSISDLTPKMISDFIYELGQKEYEGARKQGTLSVSSLKNVKTALSSALRIAVEHGLIQSNPVLAATIRWKSFEKSENQAAITSGETEKRLLSVAEMEKIVSAAQGTHGEWLVLLMARMGLRISEALGVRGTDFDLENKVLKVRAQLQRGEKVNEGFKVKPGDLFLAPLKTKNSKRDLPLPESVLGKANRILKLEDFVVAGFSPTKEGKIAMDHTFAQDVLIEVFKKAGVWDVQGKKNPTSHSLRFSWISFLLNEKAIPVSTVSRLAGHASISTTLAYYSRANEDQMKEAMAQVG